MMKKKVFNTIALSAVLMLSAVPAWAQSFKYDMEADHEKSILQVGADWGDKPLKVNSAQQKAGVRDFAKAFCSQFMGYVPNAAILDYLSKPLPKTEEESNALMSERGYFVDDAPRNGYLKCDMGWQCGFSTEICYWRRPNGHSLVGILLFMGHENETNKHALLFYDYNPSTKMMTPDKEVFRTVDGLIGKHPGSAMPELPKEGKNIKVAYSEWIGSDSEDWRYHEFTLLWTGNGFKGGAYTTTIY